MKQSRVNEEIDCRDVILIDAHGRYCGQVLKDIALSKAQDQGLDLVQVSGPPYAAGDVICKILDYGKLKYQQTKKHKQKASNVKEIRISFTIAENDLAVKRKKIAQLLLKGHKVSFSMQLRGRERGKASDAMLHFKQILETMSDFATWRPPSGDNRHINTQLTSK